MSFLKKVNTTIARAKQNAMVAIGISGETVDVQFNQEAQRFAEQYAKMKKLGKYVGNYLSAVKDLGGAQHGMSQMILDQYEPHCPTYRAATNLNEKTSTELEALRQNLELRYQETFMNPLSEYLAQYKIIEDRITERKRRCVDMDRYKAEVKTLMEKGTADPIRLQMTKEKCDAATAAYTELNDELLRDIPLLLDSRFSFFDSLFANLVDGQIQFLNDSVRMLGAVEQDLRPIDRSSHLNHLRVITDESVTAARRGAVMPHGGAEGYPAQPGQAAYGQPAYGAQGGYGAGGQPAAYGGGGQPAGYGAAAPGGGAGPYASQGGYPPAGPAGGYAAAPGAAGAGAAGGYGVAAKPAVAPAGGPSPYGQQAGYPAAAPGGGGGGAPAGYGAAAGAGGYGAPAGGGGAPAGYGAAQAAPAGYGAAQPAARPPAAPSTPAVTRARALYPFQGQDDTELTFQYNDVITVVREAGEWWEGEINGRRGLFPANYVQKI